MAKIIQKMISFINTDVPFENETKQIFVILRLYSILISIYFLIFAFLSAFIGGTKTYILFLPWLVLNILCFLATYRFHRRTVFHICSVATLSWIICFNVTMGWDCGVQHFIFPLLLISFFATYDNLKGKIIYTVLVFFLRISLYLYTRSHTPTIPLSDSMSVALQFLNTGVLFLIMFIICWFFSQTNQETQAKLFQYNEQLKRDASTDALTGLLNRRNMYDLLKTYTTAGSTHFFTIAMGDIDFFKHVNDTKGHDCGDAVLKTLSAFFQNYMEGKGTVCRWGGEEFFFLFPDTNGDKASAFIADLNMMIASLPIIYKEEAFHVTMTFGVEEYDFSSSAEELIKRADDKLYLGKKQGRNKVIY